MSGYKRHIMTILHLLACIAACLLAVSCRKAAEEVDVVPRERASLVLYTGIMGKTRAATIPDNEKIHTLRVILLRADGTVELNKYIDGLNASELFVQKFWVFPNEEKKIVLIANEYSNFSNVLDQYHFGKSGLQEALNNITFTFDSTKPIPMTGIYDIPPIGNDETLSQTLNVIRAATKFSFEFVNEHDKNVEVKSISISKLATTSYLLPQFTREGIWSDRENSGTFASYGFELDGTTHDSWAGWLQALVDKQQAFPERTQKTFSDQDGWIMEYNIPNENEQTTKLLTDALFTVGANTTSELSQFFYYPESKNLKDGATLIPDYEQSYVLNLTMGDEGDKSYTFSCELPNLRALFRNTHVHVTVDIKKHVYQPIEVNTVLKPWEEGKGQTEIDITPGISEPGLTEK